MIKMGGGLSIPINVKRGIRQGCSLSGQLYSIVIEPVLCKLRRELMGLQINTLNCSIKLSAYADDVTVIIRDQSDIQVEVCTGSKLKPEPGPYPRLSDPTRPDPSGTVKFRARTRPEIPPPQRIANKKKRKKAAFHDCMQRNRLIKALPFHKHLPVMKVCEHQVQRSHTFCRVYEFCMDKKIILPPYKLWSFFVS